MSSETTLLVWLFMLTRKDIDFELHQWKEIGQTTFWIFLRTIYNRPKPWISSHMTWSIRSPFKGLRPRKPAHNRKHVIGVRCRRLNVHTWAALPPRETSSSTPNESRGSMLSCSVHPPRFVTFFCASSICPDTGCPQRQMDLKMKARRGVREMEWMLGGRHVRLRGRKQANCKSHAVKLTLDRIF